MSWQLDLLIYAAVLFEWAVDIAKIDACVPRPVRRTVRQLALLIQVGRRDDLCVAGDLVSVHVVLGRGWSPGFDSRAVHDGWMGLRLGSAHVASEFLVHDRELSGVEVELTQQRGYGGALVDGKLLPRQPVPPGLAE